jgi:hypothetical protein
LHASDPSHEPEAARPPDPSNGTGGGPPNASSAIAPESRSSDGASSEDSESSLIADARQVLGKALDEHLDEELLDKLFAQVLALEKTAWGYCKSCEKSVQVSIPDAKAVVSALSDLLTQSKGRPGSAEGADSGSWVLENHVHVAEVGA